MKIEGNRPNVDASAAAQVDSTRLSPGAKGKGAGASGDAVTVSRDVALAAKAIDSARQAVGNRADAVARGKALLANGELGRDAAKLADSLIQHLIDQQD